MIRQYPNKTRYVTFLSLAGRFYAFMIIVTMEVDPKSLAEFEGLGSMMKKME